MNGNDFVQMLTQMSDIRERAGRVSPDEFVLVAKALYGYSERNAAQLHRLYRDPHEGETDEQRKQRLHKMYGDNSQEHEFVIKGEHIMARDKKTALKIYGNRHPEKKKSKK